MTRGTICGAATLLVLLTAALALAQNKVVTTKSGQTFEGEVTQSGDKVIITPKNGAKVTLHKDNVDSIADAATTEEQFRERLAKLRKNDSKGRVDLARWAADRKEYSLALDALDGALAIDPNNEEAIQLQRTIDKQRRLTPAAAAADAKGRTPAAAAGAGTAKQGARPAPAGGRPTRGAAAEPPAAEDPDAAPPADARRRRDADADADADSDRPKKTRLVTQDEINRIRQLELGDNETVTFRLQNDVRHRYLSSSDWEPKEFNKLTPAEQGMEILKNGASRLHADVVIATDPAALATFKSTVQRNVLAGCATSSCHGRGPTGVGGDKGGRFILHNPADKAPETYTNFLLMQDYKTTIDGKERAIIDRPRPENSLVLQYGLPLRDADFPHPEVQNFRPLFKGRNDPKYRAIEDWIGKSLAAVPPEYGIDLTKEPAGATTRPSRGGGGERAERAGREQR